MFKSEILKNLERELKNLPGEDTHLELSPTGRGKSSEALRNVKHPKQSAVSLILYEENKDLHFILIQRTEYNGTHSKQISFPGGKKEPSDTDYIATALRETEEEVGIAQKHLNHIGKLTKVYIPVSNFEVHPHIFFMQKKQVFKKQIREVDEILTIPVSALLNNQNLHKKNIPISKAYTLQNVPCFVFNEKIVWGATAIILNEFKTIINRFKTF